MHLPGPLMQLRESTRARYVSEVSVSSLAQNTATTFHVKDTDRGIRERDALESNTREVKGAPERLSDADERRYSIIILDNLPILC